ncbi:glycosyltransferase family 1 protein [Roseobacter sp.]|uniref:glycosyltransferase family 4 protein n=1 Tax=Roseobacter sp. TaxID=1907202 RepID=UPI003298CBD4
MTKIVINGKFLGAGLNGVHRTAAHYATALMERAGGHDVRLVAPKHTAPDPAFPLLVPQVVPGAFGTGQGWEAFTLPRIARGAVLVNFCNLGPVLHRNSAVMIHDAQTYLYPRDYSGAQALAYRALLPIIGRAARRVFTVSEFSRQSLAEHRIATRDKIDVVHNGADHILSVPADPSILQRLGVSPGSFVMTLGSRKGYKNIRRVFEAMKALGPAAPRLIVAGGPDEAAYRDAGWTPPENTVFTGFISDGELRACYEAARVFAFPSQTEGFGLPPIEAMFCGCPVVAASAGAMPEVCGDGAAYANPEDTEAWAREIGRLVSDDGAAANRSARGSATARSITWDNAGDRLWSVLEPLL